MNEAEIRSREKAQYDWMMNRITMLEKRNEELVQHVVDMARAAMAARGEDKPESLSELSIRTMATRREDAYEEPLYPDDWGDK